jgi:PST family polysaccharide transporter
MVGFCPLVIQILYSESFNESAQVLRLQLVGDVLKIVSWPLGYLILASGDGKRYFWSEASMMAAFVIATSILLPRIGLEAAGIGFIVMYSVYLPIAYWIVKRKTGFNWDFSVKILFMSTLFTTISVLFIANWSNILGMVASTLLAGLFGIVSVRRLRFLLMREDKNKPVLLPA